MSTKHTSTSLAKAGEPVFFLRAQDHLAPIVVRRWAQLAKQAGAPLAKVMEAYETADEMEAWQAVNGSKLPD